jgi:hypothetical protein
MGLFKEAYLAFGETRDLPSIVDYDFWTKAE